MAVSEFQVVAGKPGLLIAPVLKTVLQKPLGVYSVVACSSGVAVGASTEVVGELPLTWRFTKGDALLRAITDNMTRACGYIIMVEG